MRAIARITALFLLCSLPSALAAQTRRDGGREIAISVKVEGKSLATVEADYRIDAPAEVAWKVIQDQEGMLDFVPRMLYSKMVSKPQAQRLIAANPDSFDGALEALGGDPEKTEPARANRTTYYILQNFDFPWPAADRWVLSEFTETADASKRVFTRRFERVAGNVVMSQGHWIVRPSAENPDSSEISYKSVSDPGFQVPDFLEKPASRKATRSMLEAIRKKAEAGSQAPQNNP